jgi:hypothetical protein
VDAVLRRRYRVEQGWKYLDSVVEQRDSVAANDVRARRAAERAHECLGIA